MKDSDTQLNGDWWTERPYRVDRTMLMSDRAIRGYRATSTPQVWRNALIIVGLILALAVLLVRVGFVK